MSAIIVLVIRGFIAISLYGFLIWAIYTIWVDLQTQISILQSRKTPVLNLAVTNMLDDQNVSFSIPEVVVGRSATCAYIVHNETVSSNHARLTYHHDQWWVEDLRSTNGTFLNDEKIATPTVMMNGDDLRCGQVSIRVSIEEPGSHS
jgi:pSer/pThr/pTyr-binding forkhead associated (FHA) protein